MNKTLCAIVAGAAIALSSALPGLALAAPGGPPGAGMHSGSGARPAFRGPQEFGGHPAFRGNHEFGEHHELRGHRDFHSRIFVYPGFWWDPGYPYYADPPVIVQPGPPVYVQPGTPADQGGYWYYCQNPQGYYPYIKECPEGWVAVVPSPPSPAQ